MGSLLKKYNEQVRIKKTLNQPPTKCITNLTVSRPLMVGPVIDEKVWKLLYSAPMWGRSILQRLGCWRKVATTGRVEIPEEARKEAGLQHHFRIVNILEKHNIPKSLVLNSDQTSSKYATFGRTTMAPKSSTRVGLAWSTYKRRITMNLTVTLDGKILPFQIISGKFSTSVNEKHYTTQGKLSNICRKLLYHTSMRREKNRRCWSICTIDMRLFSWPNRSQNFFTTRIKNIEWYVPNNMTDYFQVLDLTVNKWVKNVMKQKFNEWFATQLRN